MLSFELLLSRRQQQHTIRRTNCIVSIDLGVKRTTVRLGGFRFGFGFGFGFIFNYNYSFRLVSDVDFGFVFLPVLEQTPMLDCFVFFVSVDTKRNNNFHDA